MNVLAYAFKDLKSQKTRAILGIIGVTISIFMLSTVSFLTDSVSSAYVDFLTYDSGNIDFSISRRYQAEQPNEDYWMNYTDMIDNIQNATDKIDGFIPRVNRWYSANSSNNEYFSYFDFVGLNVSYEKEIEFGKIINSDYDFETYGIPRGNCAISLELSNQLNIFKGDFINISRWRESNGTAMPGYYMNLTVIAVLKLVLSFQHLLAIIKYWLI